MARPISAPGGDQIGVEAADMRGRMADGWSAGSAISLLVLSAVVSVGIPAMFGMVAGFVLAAEGPPDAIQEESFSDEILRIVMFPSSLAVQLMVLGLVYRAVVKRGLPFVASMHLSRWTWPTTVGFISTGFAYSVIATMVIASLGMDAVEEGTGWDEVASTEAFYWIAGLILFAPLVEELLFRGYMYAGLKRSMGAPMAAALVTAIFVVAHVPMYGFHPAVLTSIGIIGVALIVILERTRSLMYCIAFHFGVNAYPALSMLLFARA